MAIVDRGWKKLKRELYSLNGQCVEVGVFASLVGAQLVLIAAANHEGTRKNGKVHIPRRPFILNTYRKRKRQFTGANGLLARQFKMVERGQQSASGLLHEIGQYMASEVQEMIHTGPFKANAASTVRQKGFNHPLEETGKLAAEGISYQIGRGQ